MNGGPLVLLGLDALDPVVARDLASRGRMPTIARLLETAAVASTHNPEGFFVGTIWPTLSTSRRITDFHCWEEIEAGGYERRLTTPATITAEPFWRQLARCGLAVGVLDVPHLQVASDGPAVEVSEWGCHDRHFGFQTCPPELAAELERRFGLHPVLGLDAHVARDFAPDDYFAREGKKRTLAEERRLAAKLLEGARIKADLSLALLERRPWDLFISVFGESHAVGHQLWHVHDPTHPDHDPGRARALGDPVADVYAELDRAVGLHMQAAGPDATVLVLLSHGMAEHFDGTHLLPEILRRLDASHSARGVPAPSPAKRIYSRLPRGLRRRVQPGVASILRRRDVAPREGFVAEDRASQRFFASPNNTVFGGVRLNVEGREANGVVRRGAGHDRVCGELERDLLELVNVDTGGPVVAGVVRTDAHYRRERLDSLPDLWVDWVRGAPIERVWSPRIGYVHAPYTLWRTGDHRPDGLLLASGPGIEPGPKPRLDTIDLGPSIADRLGAELEGVEGVVGQWLAAIPAPAR